MFQASLLALVLSSGTLVGPYRVAQAEPRHHQVSMRAAMAADGRFAIAWVDSLQFPDHFEVDTYIRFFNKDGSPMTDPYKVKKIKNSSIIRGPTLEMDTLGNTILLWEDDIGEPPDYTFDVRFQCFKPDGTPIDTAKILYSKPGVAVPGFAGPGQFVRPISLSNRGEFVFVTSVASYFYPLGTGVWVQRFNLDGEPLDTAFLAHENLDDFLPQDTVIFVSPCAALNDAGDVVVTWLQSFFSPPHDLYPRFQVFDRNDKPILPWEPKGYRIDDGDTQAHACR
ncbi:MAG: hypothetical protein U9Q76_09225, partial [candidate division WOR-3 bacterium]|nr:hypothetical protein [candidate division WOR-3 bacterium]